MKREIQGHEDMMEKGRSNKGGLWAGIVKDLGMRNEASPESVRLVIHPIVPLSIRPVVHANRHPGSSEVAGCTPSLF
jgi:hypothetical protein